MLMKMVESWLEFSYFGTLVAHTFVAAASRGRIGRPPAMARLKALDERFQASHLQLHPYLIAAQSSRGPVLTKVSTDSHDEVPRSETQPEQPRQRLPLGPDGAAGSHMR